MYTIDDLNVRLLSELKEIAEGMGVKNAKKLTKQDLVYKILDQQAVSGDGGTPEVNAEAEPERKMRPRRRENVAPAPPKNTNEVSSDDSFDSINLDFDNSITKFEEKEPFEEKHEKEAQPSGRPEREEKAPQSR